MDDICLREKVTLTRTEALALIKKHGINPKKSLGQNFVVEPNSIRQIVGIAEIEPDDFVLEVGPGLGSLTRSLLEASKHVTVIEVDETLVTVIKDSLEGYNEKLQIIHADVMDLDLERVLIARNENWNLVANLPYNIAVPLICEFLEKVTSISKMTVMVQREVADRLVAKAGQKAYGLPSLKVEYYAEVKKIVDVPPTVFLPKPKVESSIVQIERRENKITTDTDILFGLAKQAFNQRRKMLRKSLKEVLDSDDFDASAVDSMIRAEDVTLDNWVSLTRQFVNKQDKSK